MEELFLLVFQQRHVSGADMKHAVTGSYLNVSLSGKVRQQLTDVLQPAWPLKHISMLMDVRCRPQKHALDLPHPPPTFLGLRFTKLTLHAQLTERGTVKYKQLKLIGGATAGESASRKSYSLTEIEFSGRLWKNGETFFFFFFTSESCERCKFTWNGNRKWVTAVLRMWHSCPDVEMGVGGVCINPQKKRMSGD